ncbi:MAG: hypothetical protein R6V46_00720 [Desulfatiglandaceae bacterium]|jgi:hypothetical protein
MLARSVYPVDRRSVKDRRRPYHLAHLTYRGPERRGSKERRLKGERRAGWVRVSKWSSVYLKGLKIAKFLD